MDGEITIGTSLNTDKFDKQIADLEKKMQKEEQKNIEISTKQSGLEQIIQDYETLRDEVNKTSLTIEQFKKIRPAEAGIKTSDYLQSLNSLKQSYNELSLQLKEQTSQYMKARNELEKINTKHKEINAKVSEYKQKIESVKLQKQVSEVNKMKDSFKNVGSSIQSSINKVSRLALGIFGLRSAYMALRRASSDLASYDQQYATNLEYIRYALTQAIAPALKYIVNLVATLLSYLNAILQGWFGINIFSRGSVESFNKMKAEANGLSKAVKEIKKQLAGFDEINMLTEQSDTGTAGGAGGVGMPSFDLSAMQGEPPEWLKWIIDNKDLILSILGGIAGALIALKLGLGGIKALGIGALIGGIIYTIQSLLKYLEDPSWENFGSIIQGVGIAILGVGALIGGIPAIVIGAIVLIVGTIIKYWEEIKNFFQGGIDWLTNKSDWVHEMFGDVIGNIYDNFVSTLQTILNIFDSVFTMIKGIFDGLIMFIEGVFTGDWEKAWEGIKNIFSSIWEGIKNIVVSVWNHIKTLVVNIAETVGNIISGAFKAVVNAVLRAIENILNAPIRAINGLIGIINAVPGINLGYLNTFNLPRLKSGAILNMPNRGTLVGGGRAIAGEAGHEGIIPLDDQQAMSTLGSEIGKNVVVNLTNITQMNGRVIGRELKQVRSQQDFAYNS